MKTMVPLRNFIDSEHDCRCGCGFKTDPELLLKLQAFIYILERIYGCSVRCFISGPARCVKHNTAEYKGKFTESYHCGINRGRKPSEYGAALDIIAEICPRGDWARISKDALAKHAIESKLFGGVGWKIYGPAMPFVHVDLGPARTF